MCIECNPDSQYNTTKKKKSQMSETTAQSINTQPQETTISKA